MSRDEGAGARNACLFSGDRSSRARCPFSKQLFRLPVEGPPGRGQAWREGAKPPLLKPPFLLLHPDLPSHETTQTTTITPHSQVTAKHSEGNGDSAIPRWGDHSAGLGHACPKVGCVRFCGPLRKRLWWALGSVEKSALMGERVRREGRLSVQGGHGTSVPGCGLQRYLCRLGTSPSSFELCPPLPVPHAQRLSPTASPAPLPPNPVTQRLAWRD